MDRLQIAIEKARAQRAAALESRPEPAVGKPPPPQDFTPTIPEASPASAAEAAAETPAKPPVEPVAVPAPPPTPTPVAAAPVADPGAPSAPAPRPAPAAGAWEALRPFDTGARALRTNRLLETAGGPQSVPYDLLRTRMLHQARQNGWKRIGIISPTAGCGKTTAAANLAFAFSRQDDVRTVLLDLDLRRPRLAQILGQNLPTSMEDVLRGDVSFADHAVRLGDNVAIGCNTGPARNPSELLQSDRTQKVMRAIEDEFAPDLVLVDLPPMMSADDNFGFLSRVDCVLLLVAAEQSTTEQIEVTLRQLADLTSVMGIVLNKCRHAGGAYGYDNNYYY